MLQHGESKGGMVNFLELFVARICSLAHCGSSGCRKKQSRKMKKLSSRTGGYGFFFSRKKRQMFGLAFSGISSWSPATAASSTGVHCRRFADDSTA